ncbi:MAG: hypothetical protein ABI910_02820 [Gemmatimonadota bacterium]
MNRAPHAAWRTLLAAGGAPAASHAALGLVARGDALDEALLAPLAQLPLLRDGRFDALVRPIELSSVLGRHVGGTGASPVAADVTADASGSDAERGRYAGARAAAHREDARGRESARGIGERTSKGDDTVLRRPTRQAPHHPPAPPRFTASETTGGTTSDAGASAGVAPAMRTNGGAHGRRGEAIARGGRASLFPPVRSTSSDRVHAPLATHGAARTPVVIGASPASVRRLLDAVSPDAAAPSGAQSRVNSVEEPSTPRGPHDGSAIERALARISDRGNARGTSRETGRDADTTAEPRRAGRPIDAGSARGAIRSTELRAEAIVPNDPKRMAEETARDENGGGGGFRGLVTQAIRQTDGAIPAVSVAESRLSREVRTISDLPLDTLDASVAESVTRILQREARRHGIDLAETGT